MQPVLVYCPRLSCQSFIPLSPLRESEEGASVYLSTNTPSLSSKKTAASYSPTVTQYHRHRWA
ncbi:hypothetical protein, partial [Porphyromonas loveana]|uniref:hypothetical protein n=1 Tax=Porphyromonas loveana TaxID=1884669 RepID=UPI0035A0DFBC